MRTLEQTKKEFNAIFLGSSDFLVKQVDIGATKMCFFYLDGLIDKNLFERDILQPLVKKTEFVSPYAESLRSTVFFAEDIKVFDSFEETVTKVAEGDIALFIENPNEVQAQQSFFIIGLRKYATRSIAEPPTESVIRGPREGFVEDFKTNITMIRRRMKTPNLHIECFNVGKRSNTVVTICHLHGIANPEIVEKIKTRIQCIDIDGIVDSSYLTSFLCEHKHSIFSEIGECEKPDILTAKLLEGRVGIIVDGSPIVLTMPFLILETMQDSYDYYSNEWHATISRIWRFMGAMMTILLPALFVALQGFHYHILPLKFVMTLLKATSGIPFPPPIEMLIVLILFEILNQASIRMPRFMGISLSIVGAVVLGDTAVKAGLIGSPAVLVTALSAIGVFCVPDQVSAMSILRLLFLCIASVLGLYGILIGILILVTYLTSINSYATPYLAPFAPIVSCDLKDSLLKNDLLDMKKRPSSFPTGKNNTRLKVKNGK